MRKLGIEQCLVRLVLFMYKDMKSRGVGDGYSEVFDVGVGVYQSFVFKIFLFVSM